MDEQPSVIPVRRPAVTTINDKPCFELAADEFVVRIAASNTEANGRFMTVHLRPYTSDEMKACLRGLKARFRDMGPTLIQEDPDPSALRRLCDETFLSLGHVRLPGGAEPAPEQMREWMNQNPRIKSRVANEAFATVILLGGAESGTAAGDTVFELALDDCGAKINYLYVLYSVELLTMGAIEITHHFEPETENDYQAYDRATRRETDKASGFTTIDVDYDALEKLYNRTIIRIDGMVLEGQPTAAVNKNEWLRRVPFWHKLIALNARFDDIAKKNIA